MKTGREIIIGDIHGCSGALQALLEKLEPDPDSDTLIFLGDLFDRGPDSWGVLQEIKRLEEEFGERFVLLRGNHEDYLLQPKLSFSQKLTWDRVGRRTTEQSFRKHGEKMTDCIPWVQEHVVLWHKGKGFSCVHAGLLIDPPELNDMWTMVHDHTVVLQNRYAGPLIITGHIALDEVCWFAGDGDTTAVCPEKMWQPLPARGTICIDTGCGKGGRLTGMIIRDEAFTLTSVPEA